MMQKGFTSPVIIILILSSLVGFFLGIQYQKQVVSKTSTNNLDDLKTQLVEKEEEIQLLLNDSAAEKRNPSKSNYSFQSLGVYSPLFENKEVATTIFTYKRQTIIQRSLSLEENSQKNSTAGIEVWEYPNLDNSTGDLNNPPYVIFGGYESGTKATIVDLDPKDKESYINPKKIKMFWSYQYCPKSVCGVILSFFSKYAPNGHPIYTQVWVSNYQYSSDGINQSKEKLKKIADTIEDFSTYH